VKNWFAQWWPALVAVLGAGAVVVLTQCSSFDHLKETTKTPDPNRFGSYIAGRFAATEMDPEAAATYFGSALKFDPNNAALLERLLLSEVALGNIDAAADHAEQLVAAAPKARLPYIIIGVRALRDEGYARARDAFGKVSGNPAAEVAANVGVAYASYSQGDLQQAKQALAKLGDAAGTRAFALYHRAVIEDLSGKPDEALPDYEEANRLSDTDSLRIMQGYANFLQRQGQGAKASELYAAFLAKAPGNPVIEREARQLAGGHVPPRILADARQGMAETLYGVAASSNDEHAIELPIFYLQLALALDPHHELALSLLADRLEAAKKYAQANTVYERIPSTSALYAATRQQTAQNLQKLEQPEAALKVLEQALNGTQDDMRTYAGMGDVLRGLDRYEEAIGVYTKAIALAGKPEERHWTMFFTRGIANESAKHWPAAEADLKMALTLRPQQPSVMNYLAYSWVERGINIDEGIGMLKRAVELQPQDGYIVDSLGWAYYRLGNYKMAAEFLEQAVLLEPGQSTINDHLGDVYWRLGRKLEAGFQWRHALDMKPEKADEPKIREKIEKGLPEASPKTGAAPSAHTAKTE
jgi:tetratricopeptide (TPR) repeat protein